MDGNTLNNVSIPGVELKLWVCDDCVVFSLGFSQSGVGGMLGSSLPPFQTSMSSTLGQMGVGPALDPQKTSGLFGVENKSTIGGGGKNSDVFSSGGAGVHSQDHFSGTESVTAPVFEPRESFKSSNKS